VRSEHSIATVTDIECRIEAYDWPFPQAERHRIDIHWDAVRSRKPSLFNGRVLMSHRLDVEGDMLRGGCFETDYKPFLSWRDFGFPGAPVANCFAMPALRAACGAFMLGAMSATTANSGKLYFPAGTPEPSDADANGRVLFERNILRELEEETGLTIANVTLDPLWTIVFAGPLVACMKVARSPLTAQALQAHFDSFRATQADPELDRLVAVRSPDDFDPARMPAFMTRYLSAALDA
jgi:8-oxo-dGTP pyrophosphatase MutT (NUDIX family)